MYEILNSFKQQLIPKFFQKPQNLGFKTWNAWKWEIRNLPSEEKLVKAWRNLKEEVWSEWERFGRRKHEDIEREIEWSEKPDRT